MPPIHNRYSYNHIRRKLRRAMTLPEVLLWSVLKNRGLGGKKFRRQHGIGPFVVDFYCPALRLAIELDGAQHLAPEAMEYDTSRTAYLHSLNITVVRFMNDAVYNDLPGVIKKLRRIIGRRAELLGPPEAPSNPLLS